MDDAPIEVENVSVLGVAVPSPGYDGARGVDERSADEELELRVIESPPEYGGGGKLDGMAMVVNDNAELIEKLPV